MNCYIVSEIVQHYFFGIGRTCITDSRMLSCHLAQFCALRAHIDKHIRNKQVNINMRQILTDNRNFYMGQGAKNDSGGSCNKREEANIKYNISPFGAVY